MPKGKAKSKFNYKKDKCVFEESGWCNLPKKKRCEDIIRNDDGSKACYVTI